MIKIKFISQASVVIETVDAKIWTDPWLFGTAFNNSWKLFPEPEFNEDWYDEINFLWISHEHPDHFHIPTLKSLPDEFKKRVTLLFQDDNSDKMPNAFKRLGFEKIKLLKNRKITKITEKTKVHNFQVGQMDSSLAVISGGKVVLNINDCEVNSFGAKKFLKDLGRVDVLLNQFSMAGFSGHYNYDEVLPSIAKSILNTMISNHKDLKASLTIPIASYVYFCQEDNKFMNNYANKPIDVHNIFLKEKQECRFLNINQVIDVNNINAHNKLESLNKIQKIYDNLEENMQCEKLDTVPLKSIEEAFVERYTQLKTVFSKIFLKKLKAIRVHIPDLQKKIKLSLYDGTFEKCNDKDFDIQINSQPLFFALKYKWGLQTLGVSARFLIKNKKEVWKWYRIITSLNNAELYLKPKYFFTRNNMFYLFSRIGELPNQLMYRLSGMS